MRMLSCLHNYDSVPDGEQVLREAPKLHESGGDNTNAGIIYETASSRVSGYRTTRK